MKWLMRCTRSIQDIDALENITKVRLYASSGHQAACWWVRSTSPIIVDRIEAFLILLDQYITCELFNCIGVRTEHMHRDCFNFCFIHFFLHFNLFVQPWKNPLSIFMPHMIELWNYTLRNRIFYCPTCDYTARRWTKWNDEDEMKKMCVRWN